MKTFAIGEYKIMNSLSNRDGRESLERSSEGEDCPFSLLLVSQIVDNLVFHYLMDNNICKDSQNRNSKYCLTSLIDMLS